MRPTSAEPAESTSLQPGSCATARSTSVDDRKPIYRRAARVVALVWVVGTILATSTASFFVGFERDPASEAIAGCDGLILSLVSGVVALVAMIPGLAIERGSGQSSLRHSGEGEQLSSPGAEKLPEAGETPEAGKSPEAAKSPEAGKSPNAWTSNLESASEISPLDSDVAGRGKKAHPESSPRHINYIRLGLLARYGSSFLGGLLLRTVGTVALFFAGGYYMHASPEWIAAWVLLWHVVLLAVEVFVLATCLSK